MCDSAIEEMIWYVSTIILPIFERIFELKNGLVFHGPECVEKLKT